MRYVELVGTQTTFAQRTTLVKDMMKAGENMATVDFFTSPGDDFVDLYNNWGWLRYNTDSAGREAWGDQGTGIIVNLTGQTIFQSGYGLVGENTVIDQWGDTDVIKNSRGAHFWGSPNDDISFFDRHFWWSVYSGDDEIFIFEPSEGAILDNNNLQHAVTWNLSSKEFNYVSVDGSPETIFVRTGRFTGLVGGESKSDVLIGDQFDNLLGASSGFDTPSNSGDVVRPGEGFDTYHYWSPNYLRIEGYETGEYLTFYDDDGRFNIDPSDPLAAIRFSYDAKKDLTTLILHSNNGVSSNEIRLADIVGEWEENTFQYDTSNRTLNLALQPVGAARREITGTNGDDVIHGTTGDDIIDAKLGADTIFGNAGNDVIQPGGALNYNEGDVVYGSTGSDIIKYDAPQVGWGWNDLVYSELGSGITASINAFTNTNFVFKHDGTSDRDALLHIDNVLDWDKGGFSIYGTAFDDTFEIVDQPEGWMAVGGNQGVDHYNLKISGQIRLQFKGSYTENPDNGVIIDLSSGDIIDDGYGNSEKLDFEISGDGRLEISATEHNDLIVGSLFAESFILNAGSDYLDGGGGHDIVRFNRNQLAEGVFVDLNSGIARSEWKAGTSFDTLVNIEEVRGSRFDDYIWGDSLANILRGGDGSDALFGRGGSDRLYGGTDDDYLNPGDNAGGWGEYDYIHSGSGNDKIDLADIRSGYVHLSYWDLSEGITLIINNDNQKTVIVDKGINGKDEISYADNAMDADGLGISGTSSDDLFSIQNKAGQWLQVEPGAGNDTLRVNTNSNWDIGSFRVNYKYSEFTDVGIIARLDQGYIIDPWGDTDTLIGAITEVHGTDFGDEFYGSGKNDYFIPGGGDDRLFGGGGTDTAAYDRPEVSDGIDVNLESGMVLGQWDEVTTGTQGVQFEHHLDSIEEIRGSWHDDHIVGSDADEIFKPSDGDDTVFAGGGDDVLHNSWGADILDGGEGEDTYIFSYSEDNTTWVPVIDLSKGSAYLFGDRAPGQGTEILTNIENVVVDGGLDTVIVGDDGDNWLQGGRGHDTLIGNNGRDTFVFVEGWGTDYIQDFDAHQDSLLFLDRYGNKVSLSKFSEQINDDGHRVIVAEDGSRVVIENSNGAPFDLVMTRTDGDTAHFSVLLDPDVASHYAPGSEVDFMLHHEAQHFTIVDGSWLGEGWLEQSLITYSDVDDVFIVKGRIPLDFNSNDPLISFEGLVLQRSSPFEVLIDSVVIGGDTFDDRYKEFDFINDLYTTVIIDRLGKSLFDVESFGVELHNVSTDVSYQSPITEVVYLKVTEETDSALTFDLIVDEPQIEAFQIQIDDPELVSIRFSDELMVQIGAMGSAAPMVSINKVSGGYKVGIVANPDSPLIMPPNGAILTIETLDFPDIVVKDLVLNNLNDPGEVAFVDFAAFEGSNGNAVTYGVGQSSDLYVFADKDFTYTEKAAIDVRDALETLYIAIKGTRVDGSAVDWGARIAADYDNDGMVTVQDALEILKASVGMQQLTWAEWRFINSDFSTLGEVAPSNVVAEYEDGLIYFHDTGLSNFSLTGVLTGDVDASFSQIL